MKNNRKLLIALLSEMTGKTQTYIINNLNKIDLNVIVNNVPDVCAEDDMQDYKQYKSFESLQKAVPSVDLY